MLVLFTLFEESSITPLPGDSVIYPVEGEVKYSFAGWQDSIFILSRLLGPCFGYFLFLFRYFFARKYSRVFSLACRIFFIFSTALLLLVFSLSLQDLQKATTCGDMCGFRRERMALVLCCHTTWHILLV